MKTALVTGGANGIGAATVSRLISDGFFVISADREVPERRHESQQRLDICVNLAHHEEIDKLIKRVTTHGRLDVLVNNAGIFARTPLNIAEDNKTIMHMLKVNVAAPKDLIESLSPLLLRSDNGSIVNIASVRAFTASHRAAAYSISKAILVDQTAQYAKKFGNKIRVNAVAPGDIQTAMTPTDPDMLKELVSRVPLKRLGRPAEVAAVVGFLASHESSSINGEVIFVDGGFLCT